MPISLALSSIKQKLTLGKKVDFIKVVIALRNADY